MIKELIKNTPIFDRMLVNLRRRQIEKLYLHNRESYSEPVEGMLYEESKVKTMTLARLQRKNLTLIPREKQKLRILSYIPMFSWHPHLHHCLQNMCETVNFDYTLYGFKQEMVRHENPALGVQRLLKLSASFYEQAVAEHRKDPFDVLFIYALGAEIHLPTLSRIQDELKIPIVSLCLDDKHCWNMKTVCDQNSGMRDLARLADIGITSARNVCPWYLQEGGNPIFLMEGADVDFFGSGFNEAECDTGPDVVFIGELYGFRREMMRKLARQGIHVACYGKGSSHGPVDDIRYRQLCRTSKVFLGLAGVGYSETLKNIKGRDFEVLAAGGCYLTTFEPDLSTVFTHRKHLMYYSTDFELIENIRELLAKKDLRMLIRKNAMKESQELHRWEHRFEQVFSLLRNPVPSHS